METPELKIVLSGSLHEPNLHQFIEIYAQFERLGAQILSPRGKTPIDPKAEVVRFFEEPQNWSDERVQEYHLEAIEFCTIHYTVITNGYVGPQTRKEIDRAFRLSKPRFCSGQPSDPLLRSITGWPATPEEVAKVPWQIGLDGKFTDARELQRPTSRKPPITH
ncbi:MAG TPA: hypothetical protein VJC15_02945 [Candidatus Paceibacterota bacterium]